MLPIQQIRADMQHAFLVRPFIIETGPEETHEQPHRHNFQEILWVRSGFGEQVIDGQSFSIQANSFYLIAKGQVHQLVTGVDLDGLVIRFDEQFLPNFPTFEMGHYQTMLFNNVSINHMLALQPDDVEDFELLLRQIIVTYEKRTGRGQYDILRHLLTVLLIKLAQVQSHNMNAERTAVTVSADQFQQFLNLLEAQFTRTHAVQDYANLLHLTPRQLSAISKKFVGQSAKQVIAERLMLEASRYLSFTNLSVKEIAYSLGYKDPSYFSKSFKKRYGVAPQAYKGYL
jgi:AraC family transcriptional activator of pobA